MDVSKGGGRCTQTNLSNQSRWRPTCGVLWRSVYMGFRKTPGFFHGSSIMRKPQTVREARTGKNRSLRNAFIPLSLEV